MTTARLSTPSSQPATHPATAAPARSPAAGANRGGADPGGANATAVKVIEKKDVTVRTFPKSIPQPSQPAPPTLTLVIRATETSSISVRADGQPVSHETLFAPAHTSIRATREIVARVGNAAGVTFLWKGQEIPADGAEAEVKTFVFDSDGMRVVPSAPPTAENH
jgi:hypothetical protein